MSHVIRNSTTQAPTISGTNLAMRALMTLQRATISDASLALGLAVLGMVGVAIGFSTAAHPFDIPTSLDGVLTAVQLGFVLAVLHGLRFRKAVIIMTPVLAVLAMTAIRQNESAFALLGVTLALYGVIGIGLAALTQPRAKVAGSTHALRRPNT